ncbi:MAG: hypothetical protein VB099_17880 [Candidatus Limiplasma sp.]|nr:hypothetical protein [Candidatus Limiplasma sp.]
MKTIKRLLSLGLALVALSPGASLAQEEYWSIRQLRERTQAGWTQSYETKWRDVHINAAVAVPDVDAMPVLLVADGAKAPLVTAPEAGFDALDSTPFRVLWYKEWPAYPRKLDGKRLNTNPEPKEVYNSGFAPENTYLPMSDTTFGEVCDMVEREITRAGYDASGFDFRRPVRLSVSHMFYYGYKRDALPGGMGFEFRSRVEGIPVLSHIHNAVRDHYHGENRVDELFELPGCSASYSAYDERLHNLFLWRAQPVETIATDVPLCSLDKVIAAIEPEIKAGHIRKIYELELGYVLYNEPGVYHDRKEPMVEGRNTQEEMDAASAEGLLKRAGFRYYARPMWQVNCLWVKSPSGKLRETASYTTDERNTLDYYQLLVDAQTGELIQESKAYDRCEYKGFLSWDDVHGKQ